MTSAQPRHGGACTVCHSSDIDVFIELPNLPVHVNVLHDTREEAGATPRGDIRLAFCRTCCHVFNIAFDPNLTEYSSVYENSLHYSPSFQRYAEEQAADIIARHHLRGQDVIDIGCGKGEFLSLLCDNGAGRGIGFDPSYVPGRMSDTSRYRVTIIRDFYSERYAEYQAALVCCRHVLEHIDEPDTFLANIRRAVGSRRDTVVFFEVPNVQYTLRGMAIWDIIYDHCSYFSIGSLDYAFQHSGFATTRIGQTFGDQFLTIEATPAPEGAAPRGGWDGAAAMADDVAAFGANYREKVAEWARHLEHFAAEEARAVVWGAGAKGVTFLNTLAAAGGIEYIVDINPRKQGHYISGSGQRIVGPEFLREYQPNVVIVMNAMYNDEVEQQLRGLGVDARILNA